VFGLLPRNENPVDLFEQQSGLAVSGALVTAVALLFFLAVAGAVATAVDVGALVAPLQAARERGSFGSVGGRAYEEGKRGGADATPYAAVSVLLLPRSPEFESELDAIKARSRESLDAYVEAEPKVSAARLAFEQALIGSGAGQLILGEASAADGAFRFQRVPEGAWTLLAWRETPHAKKPVAMKKSEAERYRSRPQIFGHTAVVFWSMPVTVKAGEEVTVRLHDRNEWLTGIREDRRVPDENQPTVPRTQQGAAPR
jgi:hypothetical protein